ncbi:MAG: hypothetical protein CL920_10195 [Deltaproteobacteria bacterium]|nr:hypothetical protein [Deltaproteobacteria bacterium]
MKKIVFTIFFLLCTSCSYQSEGETEVNKNLDKLVSATNSSQTLQKNLESICGNDYECRQKYLKMYCHAKNGTWTFYIDGYHDPCRYPGVPYGYHLNRGYGCDCGSGYCWDGWSCTPDPQ